MNTPPDDRSALARALELGSLATTIALEMVVPIVLGLLLDRWLGTKAVFTILGGVAGMAGGLWQLVRLSGELAGKSEKNRQSEDTARPGQPPVGSREDDTPP